MVEKLHKGPEIAKTPPDDTEHCGISAEVRLVKSHSIIKILRKPGKTRISGS